MFKCGHQGDFRGFGASAPSLSHYERAITKAFDYNAFPSHDKDWDDLDERNQRHLDIGMNELMTCI